MECPAATSPLRVLSPLWMVAQGSLLCARHPERRWGLWVSPGMGGTWQGWEGAVGTEDGDEFLPSSGRALRGLGCQEPEGNVVTRDHG